MGAIPYRSGNVGLTHFLMKHLGEVGNIPFTVLTSFNFKVVIAERITMESQKKKIW